MALPKTIHHDVVERIAGWITAGKFGAGDSLPVEAEICAKLGVSRTVVREAVKTLMAKGLLSSGPRVGTKVRSFGLWNLYDPQVIGWRFAAGVDDKFLLDLIDLRLTIEPAAAGLAAVHAVPDDIGELFESYRLMERAVATGQGYFEADLRFHTAILEATHNQFFVALVPIVRAVLEVSIRLSVHGADSTRASLPLHEAVAAAIRAKDREAATQALSLLITQAQDDIRRRGRNDLKARGAA